MPFNVYYLAYYRKGFPSVLYPWSVALLVEITQSYWLILTFKATCYSYTWTWSITLFFHLTSSTYLFIPQVSALHPTVYSKLWTMFHHFIDKIRIKRNCYSLSAWELQAYILPNPAFTFPSLREWSISLFFSGLFFNLRENEKVQAQEG